MAALNYISQNKTALPLTTSFLLGQSKTTLKHLVFRYLSDKRHCHLPVISALAYAMECCQFINAGPMMISFRKNCTLQNMHSLQHLSFQSKKEIIVAKIIFNYKLKNMFVIPKRSRNINCQGNEVVIVRENCKDIFCSRNTIVLIRHGCCNINCHNNSFVACNTYKCQDIFLEGNYITITGKQLKIHFGEE